MAAKPSGNKSVLVIGLGRFGGSVAGNYLDYIEIDGPYTVVKIHTPLYAVGRSIEDVQVHDKYGVTVVGLKAPGKEFQYGSKELVMHRNDELILMGKQDQIDHFIQGYPPPNCARYTPYLLTS